jgi:hypothetical protein
VRLRDVFILREGPEEDKWLDPAVNKTGTKAEAILRFIDSGGRMGKTWKEIQSMIVRLQGNDPEARELPSIPHDDIADIKGQEGGSREHVADTLASDFGRDEDDNKPAFSVWNSASKPGQLINRGRGSMYISGTSNTEGLARFCEKFKDDKGRSRWRVVKEIEPPFFPRKKWGQDPPYPPTRDKKPIEAKPPIVRKGGGQA